MGAKVEELIWLAIDSGSRVVRFQYGIGELPISRARLGRDIVHPMAGILTENETSLLWQRGIRTPSLFPALNQHLIFLQRCCAECAIRPSEWQASLVNRAEFGT